MAVTDGSYITEESILQRVPAYGAGFTSSTIPTDSQVSAIIEEVEADMDAALAAAGFTTPCTFSASSDTGARLLRSIGARYASARIGKAATAGRKTKMGDRPDSYFRDMKKSADESFGKLLETPRQLTEGGLSSTFSDRKATLTRDWWSRNVSADTDGDKDTGHPFTDTGAW